MHGDSLLNKDSGSKPEAGWVGGIPVSLEVVTMTKADGKHVFQGEPGSDSGICCRPDISGAIAGATLVLTLWGRKPCSGTWPRDRATSWFHANVTEDPFPCL